MLHVVGCLDTDQNIVADADGLLGVHRDVPPHDGRDVRQEAVRGDKGCQSRVACVGELEVEEYIARKHVRYALHVLPLARVMHRDRARIEQYAPLELGAVGDRVLHREEWVACARVPDPGPAGLLKVDRYASRVHVVVDYSVRIPHTRAPPLQWYAFYTQEHILEARE